jgi:hypothetical protein
MTHEQAIRLITSHGHFVTDCGDHIEAGSWGFDRATSASIIEWTTFDAVNGTYSRHAIWTWLGY